MIIIEEGGRRVCYPDPGYIFTSDGTDQYEYYDGNVPFDQVLVELPVNYTWGESMDPVQPEPGSMSTKNTMTVGNSLFSTADAGIGEKLHIIDNSAVAFSGNGFKNFFYGPFSYITRVYDFAIDYENVSTFKNTFENYSFQAFNAARTYNIEISFPKATTVKLPIVWAEDQTKLTQLNFIPKILFASEVEYDTNSASTGVILMSDGTPTNVFWMMAAYSSGITIMNGYENTITLPADGTHRTLGDYEWWDTSGNGTKFKAKKIGT